MSAIANPLPILLLLFLLVVCFVFLLDLLLLLQGDLRNANFGHAKHDAAIGPLVQILQAFDSLCASHHVSALDSPGPDFQALIECHINQCS